MQNCAYPWVALKCEVCGADTVGAGHIAKAGNTRIGTIKSAA